MRDLDLKKINITKLNQNESFLKLQTLYISTKIQYYILVIDIVVVMVRKEKNGKLIPKNRDKIKIFSAQSLKLP